MNIVCSELNEVLGALVILKDKTYYLYDGISSLTECDKMLDIVKETAKKLNAVLDEAELDLREMEKQLERQEY